MVRCCQCHKHKKGANHEQDHQQHLEDHRPGSCRRNPHGNPEGPGRSGRLHRRSSRHRRSGHGHGNRALRRRAGTSATPASASSATLGAQATASSAPGLSSGTSAPATSGASASASGVSPGSPSPRAAQERPQSPSAAKGTRQSPGQAPVGKYEERSTKYKSNVEIKFDGGSGRGGGRAPSRI